MVKKFQEYQQNEQSPLTFTHWTQKNVGTGTKICLINMKFTVKGVSKWVNANSAIFQLYHGENKLIFNEMMMRSILY
jgi:hypothetical protein